MSAADEIGEEEQHIAGEFSDEDAISDEDDTLDVQELIRQVEENNPRLRSISIGHEYNDDIDWERFGAVIGRNAHITDMSVIIDGLCFFTQQSSVQFFRGLALNRSIKILTVIGEDTLENEKVFLMFAPFFQSNPAIEFLEMKMSIGRIGFGAIVSLLRNPRSNLTVLKLSRAEIDDGGAETLSAGLSENMTLKHLDLGGNPNITQTGWQAIFASLQMPFFRLENLHLWCNNINDATLLSLSSALRHSTTIKVLQLSGSSSTKVERESASVIANAAWRDLFAGVVQSTTCTLERLQLSASKLNDDILQLLINAVAHNDRLREVNLCFNRNVTDAGWEAFSAVLWNPTLMSVLEELYLGGNSINDLAVASFAGALVANNRLRVLDLSDNVDVTPAGWETFSTVLRNPISAIEHLQMNFNSIDEHALVSLFDALNDNKKLQILEICNNEDITVTGYEAFADLLCNTSSIMATYHSNHTLHNVFYDGYFEDIDDNSTNRFGLLFRINRDNSISQAARLKIIISHFSGNKINLQPFTVMDSSILPSSIAWMANGEYSGRDEYSRLYRSSACTLLYQFIRSMPTLLE